MDIMLCGCTKPIKSNRTEILEEFRVLINKQISDFIIQYPDETIPSPTIEYTVDKFGQAYFILCLDYSDIRSTLYKDGRKDKFLVAFGYNEKLKRVMRIADLDGFIEPNRRFVLNIFTHLDSMGTNFRGKGIARSMIFAFEDSSKKIYPNLDYTELDCFDDHKHINLPFYKKIGFQALADKQDNECYPMARGENPPKVKESELVRHFREKARYEYDHRFDNVPASEREFWEDFEYDLQGIVDLAYQDRLDDLKITETLNDTLRDGKKKR